LPTRSQFVFGPFDSHLFLSHRSGRLFVAASVRAAFWEARARNAAILRGTLIEPNPSKEGCSRERVDLVLFFLELGPRARYKVDWDAETTHDRPRSDGVELHLRRAVGEDGEQVVVAFRQARFSARLPNNQISSGRSRAMIRSKTGRRRSNSAGARGMSDTERRIRRHETYHVCCGVPAVSRTHDFVSPALDDHSVEAT